MDKSSLIDFENENCFKIPSPLIPAPSTEGPRLSILANNPFDKVLKKVITKDDPFEFSPETPVKNKILIRENKENIGHLISPLQTPRLKRIKKLSQSPLRLNNQKACSSQDNLDCTDSSLQILSESFINDDMSDSFVEACKLPLPSSSDEDISKHENIPSIVIKDDSTNSNANNNTSNNGFIERLAIETKSSLDPNITSNENLNEAFVENNVKKSLFIKSDKIKFNNSFGGFNINDRRLTYCKKNSDIDDSVFIEATKVAELFHRSAISMIDVDDENIVNCTPPWLDENIVFDLDNDDKNTSISENQNLNISNENKNVNTSNENKNVNTSLQETSKEEKVVQANENESNPDLKNAKDLLNNLTAILNNASTTKVDQRTLGESLINSLALALNIEPNVEKSNKLQRSKSDSRVSDRRKSETPVKKPDNKLTVPKLKPSVPIDKKVKTQVPVDKNLKVKKEKVTSKGPLKAFIPITNMAKTSKVLKQNSQNITTPPKLLQFQLKKTSTPIEPKMRPPVAQSTPDVTKPHIEKMNSTPKRHYGFPLSPLSRPASTSDINCLNNSLSPNSGSTPNLNKSHSKLPTIQYTARRNSASDMSTSRSSSLNRSYDNNQPARPSVQLKRSSSFQNKSVNKTDNNNTVKKYGMPGSLKSLKLVPKK